MQMLREAERVKALRTRRPGYTAAEGEAIDPRALAVNLLAYPGDVVESLPEMAQTVNTLLYDLPQNPRIQLGRRAVETLIDAVRKAQSLGMTGMADVTGQYLSESPGEALEWGMGGLPMKTSGALLKAAKGRWGGSGKDGALRVVSLFDGLGGGRQALKNVDAPVEYMASEVDPYAMKIHSKNFPDTQHLGDVEGVTPERTGKIDLLIGGSPCNDLSCAKRGRRGFEGDESRYFFDYVRMLKEGKPKWFIFENTSRMSNADKDFITEQLGVKPITINANLVSAQDRKRHYWTNIPTDLPKDRGILLEDIIEKEVDPKYLHSEKAIASMHEIMPGGKTRMDRYGFGTDTRKRDKSRTVVANFEKGQPTNVVIDEAGQMRRWTPKELERLQGLPEGYTEGVSDRQRYIMTGKGFQVQVIEHILKGIPEATH